ncbi:MAG: zf-HC2 domain-containing protein [Firmicutes bacterium]|nr:zf-HC2 domain-containing protein [Bacillota bacterium]
MNCSQVRALLQAYVDGDLSPLARLRIGEHVQRCTSCAQYLGELEEEVEELAHLPKVSAGTSFTHEVMSRLPQATPWSAGSQEGSTLSSRRSWRWPLAAVAGVVAVLAGTAFLPSGPSFASVSGEGNIFHKQDAVAVPANTVVSGDLLVEGLPVYIQGSVRGDIYTIGAPIYLSPQAHVRQIVKVQTPIQRVVCRLRGWSDQGASWLLGR